MNTKAIISKCLNELTEIKLDEDYQNTIPQQAISMEIPYPTLIKYINGNTECPAKNIVKIARYYGVSTDYLLGLSNVKSTDTELKGVCEYTGLSEKAVNVLKRFKNEEQVIALWDYVISERRIFTDLALWFDRYIKSRQYCKALEIKYRDYDLKTDCVINIFDFEKSEKENAALAKPREEYKREIENEQPICLYKLQKQFIEFIEQIGNKKEAEITSVKQYDDVRGVNNGEHTGKTE